MTKHNKQVLKGALIGTLVPIFSAITFKFVLSIFPRFRFFKIVELKDILNSSDLISTFIQFGIVGNLLIFFYYMQKANQLVQKGIVLPTLIFTILAIYFKLF